MWPAPCLTIPTIKPRPSQPWTPSQLHWENPRPAPCHRADIPSSPLAVVFCAAAHATASRCQSEGPDGLQTPNRDWRCDLPLAKMYSRTGAGHYQRHLGLSPILAAWLAGRRWRMVSGMYSIQLEASAYLDDRLSAPTTRRDGATRTLSCSGTKRAETPHALGRSRIRSGGLSGEVVDYGRGSKPCISP